MHTLLVASRKGLLVVRGDNTRWDIAAHHFPGEPVTQVLADARDGAWYCALRMGHFGVKMRKSVDQGAHWQDIAAPAFPTKPVDGPWADDSTPWSVDMVWALAAGGRAEPGTLWAGCIPAGLFRSEDGGLSWQLNTPMWEEPSRRDWMGGGYDHAGIHSILVDPRNSKHVTIAVSTGGLWHTADSGASWTQRGEGMRADHVPPELTHDPLAQDVHCLAQCRADPSRMWIQHHNGIFVSSNEGRTFTELTGVAPSAFGFPVAVHPDKPDTAWFVPEIKDEKRIPVGGKLAVNRTRDGGKTFETLVSGLPQSHAYDIVYRHALALDATGTRLAFGSTTGGLWVTEDQGDSWHEITHTLPPVYAVRFG